MHSIFRSKNGDEHQDRRLFRLIICVCPLLLTATTAVYGLALGLFTLCILLVSSVIISLLRGFVPEKAHAATSIVVYATIATLVQMLVHAFALKLYMALDISLPLLAICCVILTGAGDYANRNSVLPAMRDALDEGLGFTLVLTVIAALREITGSGTFFGNPVFGSDFKPIGIMNLISGAFVVFALVIAAYNALTKEQEVKSK